MGSWQHQDQRDFREVILVVLLAYMKVQLVTGMTIAFYLRNLAHIWSRAPRPPPPWSMVQDGPPPVGWSGGSLFPLWGGCGGFGVLGLA